MRVRNKNETWSAWVRFESLQFASLWADACRVAVQIQVETNFGMVHRQF